MCTICLPHELTKAKCEFTAFPIAMFISTDSHLFFRILVMDPCKHLFSKAFVRPLALPVFSVIILEARG